jgi:hypothetical protein
LTLEAVLKICKDVGGERGHRELEICKKKKNVNHFSATYFSGCELAGLRRFEIFDIFSLPPSIVYSGKMMNKQK